MAAAFCVGSWPCTTFALIWFSVSEIDCAPCRATLTVALPRASELLIDWKPAMSPRWPWGDREGRGRRRRPPGDLEAGADPLLRGGQRLLRQIEGLEGSKRVGVWY